MAAILALPLAVLAWTGEDGGDGMEGAPPQSGTDAISLTMVNSFQVGEASQMLGLDHGTSVAYLAIMDNSGDSIRWVPEAGGSQAFAVGVPYSSTFGLCHDWPPGYDWYVNSWTSSDMYLYETGGGTWSVAFANPAGSMGRGLDWQDSESVLWQTDDGDGVWRLDASGSGDFYATPEITSRMSGLTVVERGGHVYVIVTRYSSQLWYFYEFDGSSLTYIGSADPGMTSFNTSYGLSACDARDSVYWSYVVYGSLRWIGEFSWTVTSLERSTWGSIKAEF